MIHNLSRYIGMSSYHFLVFQRQDQQQFELFAQALGESYCLEPLILSDINKIRPDHLIIVISHLKEYHDFNKYQLKMLKRWILGPGKYTKVHFITGFKGALSLFSSIPRGRLFFYELPRPFPIIVKNLKENFQETYSRPSILRGDYI